MTREEEIKQASEIIRGYQYGPTLARQGFVERAQWADAHPHWISVKDEMPPYDESVLVFCEGYTEPEICQMGQEYDQIVFYNEEGCVINDRVTHWMPLPVMPESVKMEHLRFKVEGGEK